MVLLPELRFPKIATSRRSGIRHLLRTSQGIRYYSNHRHSRRNALGLGYAPTTIHLPAWTGFRLAGIVASCYCEWKYCDGRPDTSPYATRSRDSQSAGCLRKNNSLPGLVLFISIPLHSPSSLVVTGSTSNSIKFCALCCQVSQGISSDVGCRLSRYRPSQVWITWARSSGVSAWK